MKEVHREIKNATEIAFKKAIRAFILGAIRSVPVDTGQARGTFRKITSMLGKDPTSYTPQILISPKRRVKGKSPETGKHRAFVKIDWARSVKKYTTPAIESDDGGSFPSSVEEVWKESDKVLNFVFDPRLIYYTIEDLNKHKSPTSPWRSFEKGRAMMSIALDSVFDNIPDLEYFIWKTAISTGKGGRGKRKRVRMQQQKTVRRA